MLNALTIDVEDYFQVQAFSEIIRYEDWGKYESRVEGNTRRILRTLNVKPSIPGLEHRTLNVEPRTSVRATFFCLGWIAERYPGLIKEIHSQGHEIACHGYAHQLIYRQSKEEFKEDIHKAKTILEDITGCEVIGYRAPSYSITPKSLWAFKVLIEEGFQYDSSIFPIHHDFYGMPDAPRFPFLISLNNKGTSEFKPLSTHIFESKKSNIEHGTLNFEPCCPDVEHKTSNLEPCCPNVEPRTLNVEHSALSPQPSTHTSQHIEPRTLNTILEFPISTVRLAKINLPLSGGGYFRLFPYFMTKRGLQRINEQETKPFVFYLHPWELDIDQPRIPGTGLKSKFRHYINLDKTESRLKNLLADFQFSSVRETIGLFVP
jgi:polysaccharide deacetylase family protein (PEP-CTERM system associated)